MKYYIKCKSIGNTTIPNIKKITLNLPGNENFTSFVSTSRLVSEFLEVEASKNGPLNLAHLDFTFPGLHSDTRLQARREDLLASITIDLAFENYLLDCLAEEAAEVIEAVCKIKRFKMESYAPDAVLNNREKLALEVDDFTGILELLRDNKSLPERYDVGILQKKCKVKMFYDKGYHLN